MSNQLQVILDEQNIAKENANQLIKAFGAPFEEAGEILATYEQVIVRDEEDFDTMAVAREKRIALKNVRISVERKRKELKEDIVRSGRAIDSVARFVKETIEPAEKYLETQEKFAELRAAERKAAKKAERLEALNKLGSDASMYNLDDMDDEKFAELVAKLEADIKAAEEAAAKAEADRLAAIEAEKKRQAEIEAENAKLRAEAEAREKAAAEERARLEAESAARLAEQQAILDEERRKREAIEAEQRVRAEAEAKAKREAEESERATLLAPDKEKLLKLASDIEDMTLPALNSKDARDVLEQVEGLLAKVTTYIRGNVKGL